MSLTHRMLAASMAALAGSALALTYTAGRNCDFVEVRDDKHNNIFAGDDDTAKRIALSCASSSSPVVYDFTAQRSEEDGDTFYDPWFQLAYYFWLASLACAAATVVHALLLTTCLPPAKPLWRWRLLALLGSFSAVLCVPTFVVYGVDMCASESCAPGIGTYLMISAILLWIALAVAVQYLDAPDWAGQTKSKGRRWKDFSEERNARSEKERDTPEGQTSQDNTFRIFDEDDELAMDDQDELEAAQESKKANSNSNEKQNTRLDDAGDNASPIAFVSAENQQQRQLPGPVPSSVRLLSPASNVAHRSASPPALLPVTSHDDDKFVGLWRVNTASMDDDIDSDSDRIGRVLATKRRYVADEGDDEIFDDIEPDVGTSVSSLTMSIAPISSLAIARKSKAPVNSSLCVSLPLVQAQSSSTGKTSAMSSLTSYSRSEKKHMRRHSLVDGGKPRPKSAPPMPNAASRLSACFAKSPEIIMHNGVDYGDHNEDEISKNQGKSHTRSERHMSTSPCVRSCTHPDDEDVQHASWQTT